MQKFKGIITNFANAVRDRRERKSDRAVSNGKCQKLRDLSPSNEERRFFRSFDEYKFLICTVCFSTSIVFFKLLYANRDNFRKVYVRGKRLFNAPFSLTDYNFLPQLSVAFASFWSILVDLNWLFIPAVVGIATTVITWRFVYWDSRIPGIQPASPFSPKMQRNISSFVGSSGYTFALYIGIFVFFILLVLWGLVST